MFDLVRIWKDFRTKISQKGSIWESILVDSIEKHHTISGSASISPIGMLVVPCGDKTSQQPVSKINSLSFVTPHDDTTQSHLFAFTRQEPDSEGFGINYMGTFSGNKKPLQETQELLKRAHLPFGVIGCPSQ